MVSVAAGRNIAVITRCNLQISGIVQGVGFRPYLYRLANDHGLTGWVRNTPSGVELELQGAEDAVALASSLIAGNAPPLAVISSIVTTTVQPTSEDGFRIIATTGGASDVQVAPDAALCPECREEMFDPQNRRYLYPFITCTNCGPRYSIITDTPYDRPKTTMAGFQLCPDCRKEYDNPADRRFHAQPLACPECGPQLRLLDGSGQLTADSFTAMPRAAELLTSGHILAIKGLGGYHLVVDACNAAAVQLLRERKKRDEKPFAVMVPDLTGARLLCSMDEMEERLLGSPESPIVIVRKSTDCPVAEAVAPGNGWLGVMLPYTPVHHLLFGSGAFTALVMTSANSSNEPIVYDDLDALSRLSGICDYFLAHNRPIQIPCDDSVIRVFQGSPIFYRRARGYVPRAIRLPFETGPVLAVGSEMKNTICFAQGEKAFLSQHIGDLQNDSICDTFRHSIEHLGTLLEITPEIVACDQHPDYHSSVYATVTGLELIAVQHHHAHLAACMAENGLNGDVIGLIFDGTGLGTDGTVWGGEILVGGYNRFERAGHLRPVRLPGGDAAVREPWRMAISYLYSALGHRAFACGHQVADYLTPSEQGIFSAMLEKGINSPLTSSCGRLFDAVAALLNVRHKVSYDGQAAIELEALAERSSETTLLPYEIFRTTDAPLQIDFAPMFPALLSGMQSGISPSVLAVMFHATIAQASVEACLEISSSTGNSRVVLSGGVFQNRLLTGMVYTGLTKSGLQVFTHRLAPPNDGCIALGQAAVAGWKSRRSD